MKWTLVLATIGIAALCCAQNPAGAPPQTAAPASDSSPAVSPQDAALKAMFETKIKIEWEALKNRDRKAYGALLADDYIGVEADGRGERNKLQSINEMADLNIANYSQWGLKVTPLGPDAAFIVYEVTIQFPPKSLVRLTRIYIGELWVKTSGEWKILHYQETHVK